MARVLVPIPSRDFDPTEVAISWSVLKRLGHAVTFATPDGRPGAADEIMVTGEGLDPWAFVPGLRRVVAIGRMMAANEDARRAYAELLADPAFREPTSWAQAQAQDFDGLLLPGGHRAGGMRPYLESGTLQALVVAFFAADKPVAAICHGVLLAARSRRADGISVLHGRRTTALTWSMERMAWTVGRIVRFWDPNYYRTYPDGPDKPAGWMSVEQEVTRVLAQPGDFRDVPVDDPDRKHKVGGRERDTWDDPRPAFVVRDGNYVSARWPGDVHAFARAFAGVLTEHQTGAGPAAA
jgi:putative intracellular protease/amidase